MLIRTQDGDALINLDKVSDLSIDKDGNTYSIIAGFTVGDYDYCFEMGTYSTKGRCQLELGYIEMAYATRPTSIYHMKVECED